MLLFVHKNVNYFCKFHLEFPRLYRVCAVPIILMLCSQHAFQYKRVAGMEWNRQFILESWKMIIVQTQLYSMRDYTIAMCIKNISCH